MINKHDLGNGTWFTFDTETGECELHIDLEDGSIIAVPISYEDMLEMQGVLEKLVKGVKMSWKNRGK